MNARKLFAIFLAALLLVGAFGVNAMASTGDYHKPLTLDNVTLTFGDETNPTWPESNMYFKEESTTTYQAVYSTNGTSEYTGYYPDILSIYIVPANNVTITSITGTDVDFVTYDSDGTPTYSSTTTVNAENFYAICPKSNSSQIVVTPNSGSPVTVKFKAPVSQTASGGATPKTVCGYLPVGQFARANSMGWGTIYTDGTNEYASSKTPKFASGYVSTGVSLGMLGGYVQYEFADAIGNDADNPYGVDFVVYGNPFNGNPEAGSVMVYGKNTATETYGWYNLAGSRHYMSGTEWNVNVSYIKIEVATNNLPLSIGSSTFAKNGVYYSTNYVPGDYTDSQANTAISNASWYAIPNSAATAATPVASNTSNLTTVGVSYWPEVANSENYGQVWKMQRPDTTTVGESGVDAHVAGVYWQTNGSAPVITYQGVTKVADSDTTDDYRFGYADVRVNGSNYGVAVNPYATAPSAANGGDGFDLSWAVDADGKPVNLTDVRFVRVYSAVLYNAGIFGETSTEVCGIYVASGAGSGAASVTPTVKINGTTIATTNMGLSTKRIYNGSTATINVTSAADYIYINGSLVASGTNYTLDISPGNTYDVQIITQKGTESPYVTVLKITR
ncbi:MAG: hypothetical protein K6B40_01160 [Firmicutes bacterium]|nr:hypothetical protein [Bacillota bacterium]